MNSMSSLAMHYHVACDASLQATFHGNTIYMQLAKAVTCKGLLTDDE